MENLKSWCDEKYFNDTLKTQIQNCTSLPFLFRNFVLLPDGHAGYGMPIGGVLATSDVVIPNAVGVDIGCGMASYKTTWKSNNLSVGQIKKIISKIREKIPLGKNRHKDRHYINFNVDIVEYVDQDDFVSTNLYRVAVESLGTLGGGNHFIEFQKDEDNNVYVMIHSGSRNIGKQICDHYSKIAIELNEKFYSQVPKEWELAFLPINSKEGWQYISEMKYAVKYAKKNRELIMIRVLESMNEVLSGVEVNTSRILDVAHNYARLENHFGKNVWVHRKGATSAKEGELGIIPGSQGTNSYIVIGKGNIHSFKSCSHGAGREMGRNEAKRTLSYDAELKKPDGIVHTIRNENSLDEAPGSYKDIEEVMARQSDLIDIVTKLTPLACVKG